MSDPTLSSSTPPPRSSTPPAPTWAQRYRRSEPLRRRVALSAAIGAVSGLVLALVDATWARRGVDNAPSLLSVFAADAGIVLPLTVGLATAIGFGSWLVHPRAEPTIAGMLARMRDAGAGRPADMAAFAPLCALGLFVWATLCGQLARVVLSAELSPLLCGAAATAGAFIIGGYTMLAVLALTPVLRQRLAAWRGAWSSCVNPGVTLGLSIGVVLVCIAYGTLTGTVSGDGGILGIYGILKRQELDLRMPSMLALLAIATYLSPPLLRAVKPYQAWAVALLAMLLTPRAAHALNSDADLAPLLSRGAPLAASPLTLWRKLTDGDGDGASAYFGGGDCDDNNAAIGPGADDIPDNGIDEDCSGSDLSLAALEQARKKAAPAPSNAQGHPVPANGNVLLITIDTLRYDVGYTGYGKNITPQLDALAKRSTVFMTAYALASYTGKSVGPMLIGKYGSETHRNWGHFNKFSEEDTFVAQRFQKAGVRTIAVHGHRYFGKWGGLERGFDELDLSAAPPEGTKWATDNTVTSDALSDAAIALLDQQKADGRFFMWVHYLDPHADYLAHEGIESFGKNAHAMYDGEVAFTDKHMGRLIDHVSNGPFAKRTSIIVTSDHGELFGEHKMWRHGVELWEGLARVPLVVHVPGATPRRIDVRRSCIDLVPTMLELIGVPLPSGKGDDFISGVSLLPDVYLEAGAKPVVRDILIDMPAGPYNESRRAFIHDDLKLIVSGGVRKELYDLAADPGEKKNLWNARKKDIEAAWALAKSKLREIEVTGKFK